MMEQMPYCFRKVKYASFEDGKIIISECYSTLVKHSSMIINLILLLLFLFSIFISYILKFFLLEDTSLYAFLIFIISIALVSFFSDKLVKHHVVIDLRINCIYSELILFDLIYIKSKKVFKENISQIANNIYPRSPQRGETYTFIHPETNYVHLYSVDFLLENGKVVDMVIMGKSESDYDRTVELTLAISELWKLPAVICKDNYQLKVIDTHTYYNYRYKFSLKEIKPRDSSKLIMTILIIFIFFFILCMGSYFSRTVRSGFKQKEFANEYKILKKDIIKVYKLLKRNFLGKKQ